MATPQILIPLRIKGQTTCIHHKGRELEMYCEKCQELVCLKCLSSIHKTHPVCELSEITPQDHLKKALGKVITLGQGQTLTDQDWSVSTSDDLGQPSVTTYKLLPQTEVVEEWKSPYYIGSICPTTDGQVWTRDGGILTLLDRKGEVLQEVKHNVGIYCISLSPTTHTLWVCDGDNNIMELVSGCLTHRFSTKEVPLCICITASNNVIIGMAKHISKFTTDGKMVCTTMGTTMAKGTGEPLVCSPGRISECPVTHNVAVADFNSESDGGDGKGHVVVMDTDFKELFVYRPTPQTGGEPFDPYGVVYDSVGNLIIGDLNNRVLLISGGGGFLRVIHTDTYFTSAVGIDRDDVVWAGFGGNDVKLLQYSSM